MKIGWLNRSLLKMRSRVLTQVLLKVVNDYEHVSWHQPIIIYAFWCYSERISNVSVPNSITSPVLHIRPSSIFIHELSEPMAPW